MAYNMITLRAALERLGYGKNSLPTPMQQSGATSPFLWKGLESTGDHLRRVSPKLTAKFVIPRKNQPDLQIGRRQNFLNDITEYCWIVYSKAMQAVGRQLVGRQGDLWIAERLEKAGINLQEKHHLWDEWTKGNIQVMDKWSKVINDCWILGGVHRRADFELVSKTSMDNLWDSKNNYHVVTARELLGLLHFGYELTRRGGTVIYTCYRNPSAANGATIEAYRDLMVDMEALGQASVQGLLDHNP